VDSEVELKKLAEECGELTQACMKTSIWGVDNFNPKTEKYNGESMTEEMGDLLCHLKRTANALGISWDDIQQRSFVKNDKVNKYHYGEKEAWEIQ